MRDVHDVKMADADTAVFFHKEVHLLVNVVAEDLIMINTIYGSGL